MAATAADSRTRGGVRPILAVLVAAAIVVLLVACGNVASLPVGRAITCSHDLAVRLALGASRWQLVRAVLAESLIVAIAASALGASPGRMLRIILGEGMVVTAAGVIAGLGIAAAVGRTLARLLYGVSPCDPLTFGAVALLVGGAGVGICYLAARRALRVDLLELLRAE